MRYLAGIQLVFGLFNGRPDHCAQELLHKDFRLDRCPEEVCPTAHSGQPDHLPSLTNIDPATAPIVEMQYIAHLILLDGKVIHAFSHTWLLRQALFNVNG